MSDLNLHIKENVSLARYSTLQVGGVADNFVSVGSIDELKQAVKWAKNNSQPVTALGGGSNVLVSDGGVEGLVIKVDIKGIESTKSEGKVSLYASAGEDLDEVIAFCVKSSFWGLENLSAIPGSVGAAPVQNVGAYGVEVSDCIESVAVFDIETMQQIELTKEDCKFSYRNSLFKSNEGKRYIVVGVKFNLSAEPKPILSYRDLKNTFPEGTLEQNKIRQAVIDIRSNKFPDWKVVGTAGSFFKNPIISKDKYYNLLELYPDLPNFPVNDAEVKVPLGYILDKICKLKGVQQGKVGTYIKQALVLINYGQATEADITNFANSVSNDVKEKTGIEVEWEVTRLS